jgi:L-fuconolactonase
MFLQRSAALAVALGAGQRPARAEPRVGAIDTHTHFYDTGRPQGVPWPGPSDELLYRPHLPGAFEAVARPHGVVGTIAVEASPWPEDNQWVLELAEDHPIIVGFVGNLQAGRPGFAADLERYAGHPLFLGLRFGAGALARGLGEAAFESDVRRVAERRFTLDLLGGASMLSDAARLARLAPELPIVLNHLPFPEWDGDPGAAGRALADLVRLPNVHAKVSGVVRRAGEVVIADPDFHRPALDALWDLFGPDRLLFGSNWPVSERIAPYSVVHGVVADYLSSRGSEDAERFFWRNALDVYRWKPRGAAAGLVTR